MYDQATVDKANEAEDEMTISTSGTGAGALGSFFGAALGDSTAGPAVGAAFGVPGALLGGVSVGYGMEKLADSDGTRNGFWGKDDGGQNRSAMDWGASWGTDYDRWAGNTTPIFLIAVA
jgi:hypothetical protein